ncbi:MAG: hypothetical protein JWO43_507 [Candidatus Adlerbacteria bacterium]|nr:hypothetical protein [Candidatus Adlerbacteria bacterium]
METEGEKLSGVLSGIAGEYFVAAELSKRGLLASITLRNTKGVDILCSNAEASKSVGIQVKTKRGSARQWIMHKKAVDYHAASLFYVFVNLNDNQRHPDFFIVPSKTVAGYIKKSHAAWLIQPGKKGKVHKDTSMRMFKDPEEKYLERWDLLGLQSAV